MPNPNEDVIPESSTGSEAEPEVVESGTPAGDQDVTTDPVDDRPLKNVQAEFNRKVSRLEQMIADLTAAVTRPAPAPPAPAPVPGSEYTDEQLEQLAQAGHVGAQNMLIQRKVDRATEQRFAERERQQTVTTQLSVLYQKYPFLASDPAHPLTQAALRAKAFLLQAGAQNSHAVDLDAIKTALAENPELVAQTVQQRPPAVPVPETVRRSSATAQTQMDGATPRRTPQRPQPGPAVSDKARAIAQRMGIKDPSKAMQRFQERQDKGRSAVSPQVSMIIRDQEGGR